jgi:hypothetical protein
LLVGVALMIPTAAADPYAVAGPEDPLEYAIKLPGCSIAKVQTNTLTVYFVVGSATINGRTLCI